jgi:hypothetical protein
MYLYVLSERVIAQGVIMNEVAVTAFTPFLHSFFQQPLENADCARTYRLTF